MFLSFTASPKSHLNLTAKSRRAQSIHHIHILFGLLLLTLLLTRITSSSYLMRSTFEYICRVIDGFCPEADMIRDFRLFVCLIEWFGNKATFRHITLWDGGEMGSEFQNADQHFKTMPTDRIFPAISYSTASPSYYLASKVREQKQSHPPPCPLKHLLTRCKQE